MPKSHTQQLRQLRSDIDRAGYYPALVAEVLEIALADEEIVAHLVHPETVFDRSEVRRHVTALTLTPTRLIIAHVDDVPGSSPDDGHSAAATTESVALSSIRSVALTHVVSDPATYTPNTGASEITLALNWGSVQRLDLEPASCPDPDCEADHGYAGTAVPDDLVVRISAAAEGREATAAALAFAAALSAATTQ
ncbi:DUF5998 family protein [Pseudactinotalea sp. Z1748]|uniref:DUF5998 family protein n=1 Tax=Pseudactinotalea sp. Z1748 TaxID=3413027 RepID=UPI003C79A01E